MKIISLCILLSAGWSAYGDQRTLEDMTFICNEGKEGYEELKRDAQNDQTFSKEFQASIRLSLFFCQMAYGDDLAGALQYLKESAELGKIKSNFVLAEYYLTGGWGENPSVQSRQDAIWEFEKTLNKINGAGVDYPNDEVMAEYEIRNALYLNTLGHLIMEYTNKYIEEEEGSSLL